MRRTGNWHASFPSRRQRGFRALPGDGTLKRAADGYRPTLWQNVRALHDILVKEWKLPVAEARAMAVRAIRR